MGDVLQGVSPARIFARPTAELAWLGPAQKSALSHLLGGPAFRILTGPAGSGRSTLLEILTRRLAPEAQVLRPFAAGRDSASFLGAILSDLGVVASDALSLAERRDLLALVVEQRRRRGQRIVVVIDDAETLSAEAGEEIDRLAGLQFRGEAALELVLSAPASGGDGVCRELEGIVDRRAIYELGWLGPREVEEYIRWRMGAFGLSDVFSPTAAHLIARCTAGRFRGIDLLSQMALLSLKQRGGSRVDVTMVDRASRLLARRRAMTEHEPIERPPVVMNGKHPAAGLVVTHGDEIVGRHELGERILIGRAAGNDVRLRHTYVSRHHAVIIRTGQGYYVTDLSSENGIALNGRPVTGASLEDQDVLRIGPFRITLELGRDSKPVPVVTDDDPLDDTIVLEEAPVERTPLRVVK